MLVQEATSNLEKDPESGRRTVFQLLAISFLSLYFELSLIRFVNSTVQVVAYFNNFMIISAFLGLGVGSALAPSRKNIFNAFPAVFCAVIGVMLLLGSYTVSGDLAQDVFWSATAGTQSNAPVTLIIILVFLSSVIFFIPLGFKLGWCLLQFENRLVAYAYDLTGSFLGVLFFAMISYLRLQPWQWFTIGSLFALCLLPRAFRLVGLVFMVGGVLLTLIPPRGLWSPYYKITLRPLLMGDEGRVKSLGYSVLVDKLRIQDALNFGPDLERSDLRSWISYYELPYYFRQPHKILILGGGSGNDTAVALKHGPDRVDVVEIDPVLTDFGFFLHPQRPYRDPRVNAINDDARAFLKGNHETYDLIVMNALDSHHQLPGLSTLRLESYIYTMQSFSEVHKHMTPDSIFVVHLSSSRPWMGERLFKSLSQAFNHEPRLFSTPGSPGGSVAFVFGPDAVLSKALRDHPWELLEVPPDRFQKSTTRVATDDWPHLYLADNEIPYLYYKVLAVIILVTFLSLLKPLAKAGTQASLHFLFLGAGFMLLETSSITRVALLFGSTWIITAIVIASILLVIFLGNLLVMKDISLNSSLCWVGLFGSLSINYFVPIGFILNYSLWTRLFLTVCWVGLPVFFASLLFSNSFRSVKNTASIFAANLLGVVIGGSLEYSSMIFGLKFLYLIAMMAYGAAMIAGWKHGMRGRYLQEESC